jgi:hypothetical protein
MRFAKLGIFLVAVVAFAGSATAQTWSFAWAGLQVQGETDPFSGAYGTAEFTLTSSTLTLVLTSNSTDEFAIGQLLSGVLWDQSGFMITNDRGAAPFTPASATITSGSQLVGKDATTDTDLSGEWAWSDQVAANWMSIWTPSVGTVGNYGVSATGADGGFGSDDLFDGAAPNLFDNQPPDGINSSIMGPGPFRTTDGFAAGPNYKVTLVQNSMTFVWDVSGVDGDEEIFNVNPIFGTDGAFLVPEPTTLILLGGGLTAFGVIRRRRQRR